MNEITIDELLINLNSVKNNIKDKINSKKIESIGDSDFISDNTPFNEYADQIEDKLTRKLPTIDINVKVNNNPSVMGTANINGLGNTETKTFNYNDICTINAIPNDTIYEFVSWDDGNTDSCRTINIKDLYNLGIKTKEYIATFQEVIIPDEPDTPDTPDEDDTLDEPWYFWNGDSSWVENEKGLNINDFNELTDTKYTYGDENEISCHTIIIVPKGVAVKLYLKNYLNNECELTLSEINSSGISFEKLPKEFTENKDKYDFWGYSSGVDKLDIESRLIITCKKK